MTLQIQTDRISVMGAGSWGTALAVTLSHNMETVKLWGRTAHIMRDIHKHRRNTRYFPDLPLPDNLTICPAIEDAVDQNLCFLISIPSHAFRSTLHQLKKTIERQGFKPQEATIVWGTKGFDPTTGKLLDAVVNEIFGEHTRQGVISGPSFATETADALPTALTVASRTAEQAKCLADWFRTPTIRVYHSDDLTGVQLGGSIKNVMAIAAGISDGLGHGANARAALITRGLSELTRLGIGMGGRLETFMGLTGVGDLILTCTDNQSRNRRFGLGIAQGKSMQQLTAEIDQEIEGINTVRTLYTLSKQLNVDMPITEQVYQVLYEKRDPAEAVRQLLQRNPKAESV